MPFVALIVLLIGAVVSLPLVFQSDRQRTQIADSLSKLLNRPVFIGELSFGYFPPSLHLERVVVTHPQGDHFIQMDRVKATLALLGLFQLRAQPEALDIQGWSMIVRRKPNAQWDYSDWWPTHTGFADAKSWAVHRIRWTQGSIRFVDDYARAPQDVTLTQVEGSWNPRPESLEMRGSFSGALSGIDVTFGASGKFFNGVDWSGQMELRDQAHAISCLLSHNAAATTLRAQTDKWAFDKAVPFLHFLARRPLRPTTSTHMISSLQIQAKKEHGKISFQQMANISGGQSEVKGAIVALDTGTVVRMETAASGIPVDALLLLLGDAIPLYGKVTGISKDVQVTISSQTSTTVQGSGVVQIDDGYYLLPETSLKKLSKSKTAEYLRRKYPTLATSGLPFSRLHAQWQAKGGLLTIQQGSLVSQHMTAGWSGTLDLARRGMDGYIRIDFREPDPKLRALIPAKYHTQPAYGRLQGAWQEWYLRSLPRSKVPAAYVRQLGNAARAK